MFEANTEEVILKRMMDRISNDLDKREGSIVYNAIAPAAQEVAKLYSDLDMFLGFIFASPDMPEEFLDLKVAEEGLKRDAATPSIKKGYFYNQDNQFINVDIGSRFSIENLDFVVIEKISTGIYKMKCESVGSNSNYITGQLIPIEYIEGLAVATLGELLIPGEDKEGNFSLYNRYVEHLNEKPFGGNIADYKINIKSIDGVGDLKVYPIWNGGGTVKIVFIDSDYNVPTQELVDNVQTTLDPVPNQGKGLGLAPVGHVVTVEGALKEDISISTELLLKRGTTVGQVQEDINKVLNNYLSEIRKQWALEDYTIIRISQIEARILGVEGVADLFNTKINLINENLSLQPNQVPILKEVILSEKIIS